MATVAIPTCVFAQQTENENEKPVDLYYKESDARGVIIGSYNWKL